MKMRISQIRRIVREAIEEAETLDEVDTDPSNNPGRPDDPFDYIGMHPEANAAMAHPAAATGSGGASSSSGVLSEPE